MTATTKRKHVVKDMLEDFSIPSPEQQIVKVLGTPGSNLHEVLSPSGEKFLCSLPTKFRKNIWIKRGDFVVVEYILEGDKVKAEIVRILYPQHIKHIRKENQWPEQFENSISCNKWKNDKEVAEVSKKVSEASLNVTKKNVCSHGKEKFILNLEDKEAKGDFPSDEEYYSSEEDLSDIPLNTNRPPVAHDTDTSDSDESLCRD